MNIKTFNLCSLVVKYDLEKAVYENYKIKRVFLEHDERKVISQYIDDDDDNILEYVRDVLLDDESKKETLELVDKTIKEILEKNEKDVLLQEQINELKNDFVTSFDEKITNNKCMFLKKDLIIK